MSVRDVIERGPKGRKSAAVAIDWPGWSRGAKTPEAAFEELAAYRDRYARVARLAGLDAELDAAGDLDIVQDHAGPGSTDYWGISFAPSSFERDLMPSAELERKLALLEAAWAYFDAVAARVSPELRKARAAAAVSVTRSSVTSSSTRRPTSPSGSACGRQPRSS